eukprot:gene55056-21712_t
MHTVAIKEEPPDPSEEFGNRGFTDDVAYACPSCRKVEWRKAGTACECACKA